MENHMQTTLQDRHGPDSYRTTARTDMERIHSGPMAGRTVLVTGRTEGAAREIRAAGGGQVYVFVADLSSQAEVRRLADEVLQSLSRIDVLVNNVGGYWNARHVTADGLEHTF